MSGSNQSREQGATPADEPRTAVSRNIVWHDAELDLATRWELLGTRGMVIWLTGLSGSGKSTIAASAESLLVSAGQPAVRLDGDNVRHGLCADLGFSLADRTENIRRVGEVATLFATAGVVALVPLISPYRQSRDDARATAERSGVEFVECHVATSLEECEQRDPKGLYAKARAGEIKGFTGIDDPYEAPLNPELRLSPTDGPPEAAAQLLLDSAGFGAERLRR